MEATASLKDGGCEGFSDRRKREAFLFICPIGDNLLRFIVSFAELFLYIPEIKNINPEIIIPASKIKNTVLFFITIFYHIFGDRGQS